MLEHRAHVFSEAKKSSTISTGGIPTVEGGGGGAGKEVGKGPLQLSKRGEWQSYTGFSKKPENGHGVRRGVAEKAEWDLRGELILCLEDRGRREFPVLKDYSGER